VGQGSEFWFTARFGRRVDAAPPAGLSGVRALIIAGMLERLMGDEELAETIAQGFLADIPRQIEALRNYLEAGDAAGAERQAHTIKGASANVGGERLRALAFEMEKAGKAGDLESIKTRMDELAATFAELKQTMKGDTPCVS
jgi:HPt (histidine-containing phosphotransfer) domain-containing protein